MAHPPSPVQAVFDDTVVDRELAALLDTNGYELEHPQRLETGGSGGKLVLGYLRKVRGEPRPGGMRIIKLVGPSPDAEAEPANHLRALDVRVPGTEDFTERHLVKLDLLSLKVGDSWLMFQYPAGDGQETTTLARLGRTRRLPQLAAHVVERVLGGWNPNPTTGGRDKVPTAAEFVTELLGRRADPDSPLRAWTRSLLGPLTDSEKWFTLPGGDRPVPNPLLLGAASPLSAHRLPFTPRGHAHGDLHPGNIMVPVRERASAEDFWLIDLSRFSATALLARDPAHLLVCLIADCYLPHMGEEAREELLTALTADAEACPGPLIPQGLAATVTEVRRAWISWGASAHLGIDPHWRQQWFLALQACALMVSARRRYTEADRWWFYRLAAEACGAFLGARQVRSPESAPVVSGPGLVAGLPAPVTGLPDRVVSAPEPVTDPPPRGAAAVDTLPEAIPHFRRFFEPRQEEPLDLAPTVRGVLRQIWETFEPPRRQLPSAPSDELWTLAALLRTRATEFVFGLARTSMSQTHVYEAGVGDHLATLVAGLRVVATRADDLRQQVPTVAASWGTIPPPHRQSPRRLTALDKLIEGLDDVLLAVGRAMAGLGGNGL
ncbi:MULTISPECIES: hypothetical protein [Streptomyces]|uniref:Uncharacterized protein n=2 Tax=Streptomyces TaxID=1883 RepID=A0A2U9PAF0_STRAS|nr:hypothetical protein [Streptomyces actuosus]AWT46184.1 hypothetical protein DMT42_30405 [Streptomyces actuosus]MBM4822852.1 hypothetical protein [Streptomyces actuosus]